MGQYTVMWEGEIDNYIINNKSSRIYMIKPNAAVNNAAAARKTVDSSVLEKEA